MEGGFGGGSEGRFPRADLFPLRTLSRPAGLSASAYPDPSSPSFFPLTLCPLPTGSVTGPGVLTYLHRPPAWAFLEGGLNGVVTVKLRRRVHLPGMWIFPTQLEL